MACTKTKLSDKQITDKVIEILCNNNGLEVDLEKYSGASLLHLFCKDELDLVEATMECEDEFGIRFDDAELAKVGLVLPMDGSAFTATVSVLVEEIKKKLSED